MLITILGHVWRLRYRAMRKAWGECDPPGALDAEIRIHPGQPEEQELRVLIHEMLHAADWYKDETWADQVSSEMARVLTDLGWHRDTCRECE